ncbi:MAG: response regulator [Chitinophagales bacterium]
MANTITILLADDDPEDQDILKEIFLEEDPDISLHCVMNGKEVIAYLKSCPEQQLPRLIILDFKMPIMNAIETLESLKDNARYSEIITVVWSTSNQKEHIKQCMERGAIQFFQKPGNYRDLAGIARQILEILFNGRVKKQ